MLIAAVVVLAVLCVGNMLVTFAALRRLRELGERLTSGGSGVPPGAESLVGKVVPKFAVSTTDGRLFSRDQLLRMPRLIGFFSASCEPCHE